MCCGRYPPHGLRSIVVEEGVQWDRLRAPPLDMPAHDLHQSDCLEELQPGDHVEVQWRRNKDFPYGNSPSFNLLLQPIFACTDVNLLSKVIYLWSYYCHNWMYCVPSGVSMSCLHIKAVIALLLGQGGNHLNIVVLVWPSEIIAKGRQSVFWAGEGCVHGRVVVWGGGSCWDM
jgi:hypothetical protein